MHEGKMGIRDKMTAAKFTHGVEWQDGHQSIYLTYRGAFKQSGERERKDSQGKVQSALIRKKESSRNKNQDLQPSMGGPQSVRVGQSKDGKY